MGTPAILEPILAKTPVGSYAAPASLAGVFRAPNANSAGHFKAWSTGFGDNASAGWLHDGDLSLGYTGEIHNLASIGRDLGLPAAISNLSVLAQAWKRWSLGMLPRLQGVFALIVRTGGELVLYRDPSGLRNLYFERGPGNSVAFATHLAALPSGGATAKRTLAPHSVQEYLRLLEVAPPRTLLAGVNAVEAGQSVHWGPGDAAPQLGTPSSEQPRFAGEFAAAVEGLECRLRESVHGRVVDAVRPAAFLSGGVDSALLCALAGSVRRDLTAVTVSFDDQAYDEAPVARRIATHLGLTHEVWRFTREQYLDAFNRLSRHAEQPMADPAAMATLLAFEQCRQRFDAVLDGTGADEAVGLMPPRHVRLAVGHSSRLPPKLRRPLARLMKAIPGLAGYAPLLDFEHPADTMSRWHGFRRSEIEQLTGQEVSLEDTQFIRTFHRFARHAHFERYSALLDVMSCDRLNQAMAISGATVRFPFWDRETDRFIRQLPTDFRYLPGQPKRILRTLLARFVPPEIWSLPKHGFNFPLRAFLAGDDHALVRHHLDATRWRTYGLLRPQGVQRYGERFIAGDQGVTFRVWALVVLAAWLEEHRNQLQGRA